MALALKADHFRNRSDSAVPDRANIVRFQSAADAKAEPRRSPRVEQNSKEGSMRRAKLANAAAYTIAVRA
jgi:hypothetical protein